MSDDPHDESVAVYDERGHVQGSAPRSRVYAEGIWHAAAMVLVRSSDGHRVYVHLRSPSKAFCPEHWDCWAGGVVGAGETPVAAARRELAEELGIAGVSLRQLFRSHFIGCGLRYHAFAYQVWWDGAIVHQPSEVTDGRWLDIADLRQRLTDPSWPFVPDGRQFLATASLLVPGLMP